MSMEVEEGMGSSGDEDGRTTKENEEKKGQGQEEGTQRPERGG